MDTSLDTIHKNLLSKNSHFTVHLAVHQSGHQPLKTVVLVRTPLRTLLCALVRPKDQGNFSYIYSLLDALSFGHTSSNHTNLTPQNLLERNHTKRARARGSATYPGFYRNQWQT